MKPVLLILLAAFCAAALPSCNALGNVANAGVSGTRSVLGTALSPVRGAVGAIVPR